MKQEYISIRHAGTRDWPEIKKLFIECVSSTCNDDYSEEQINAWVSLVSDKERWLQKIRSDFFLVAERGPDLAGFASLDDKGFVDLLYVHSNHQYIGVAGKLIVALENEAAKRGLSVLNADVSITAKSFFKKRGFVEQGAQEVKVGEVSLVNYKMSKQLSI